MKEFIQIKAILQQELPYLKKKYQVKSLGIFGSYIHNEQNKNSDVDVLVDYEEVPSLLRVIELLVRLTQNKGRLSFEK